MPQRKHDGRMEGMGITNQITGKVQAHTLTTLLDRYHKKCTDGTSLKYNQNILEIIGGAKTAYIQQPNETFNFIEQWKIKGLSVNHIVLATLFSLYMAASKEKQNKDQDKLSYSKDDQDFYNDIDDAMGKIFKEMETLPVKHNTEQGIQDLLEYHSNMIAMQFYDPTIPYHEMSAFEREIYKKHNI